MILLKQLICGFINIIYENVLEKIKEFEGEK